MVRDVEGARGLIGGEAGEQTPEGALVPGGMVGAVKRSGSDVVLRVLGFD